MRWLFLATLFAAAACNDRGSKRTHGLIRVDPQAIDFGKQASGTTVTATLTLFNESTISLAISNASIDGDSRNAFSLGPVSTSVAAGGQETISVIYVVPALEGAHGATLTIDSDADHAPRLSVPLSGRSELSCVPRTCAPPLSANVSETATRVVITERGGRSDLHVADGRLWS